MTQQQMIWIWQITGAIICVLMAYPATKRAYWMLQQHHYHLDRYGMWLMKQVRIKSRSIFFYLILALPYLLIANRQSADGWSYGAFVVISHLYLLVVLVRSTREEAIVPLRYTARMIRTIAVGTAVQGGAIYVALRYWPVYQFGYGVIACYLSGWLIAPLAEMLLYPLEAFLRYLYTRDAKRIMKGNESMLIGITGSYGKTSCKHILDAFLSQTYYGLMTPKSYNTKMGITKTIRTALKPLHEYFICEMGSDHIGEIADMMTLVPCRYGVVTAIGKQHLSTFKSIDTIVQEKMSLIEHLPEEGIAFLNRDDERLRSYDKKNPCRTVWFSIEQASDYQAKDIRIDVSGTDFTILVGGNESYRFHTRLLGKYNVMNITAMVAVAHTLGVPMDRLQKATAGLDYVEHRLEVKDLKGRIWIDNSYNANEKSVKEALEILSGLSGKRVLITSGVVEMGAQQDEVNHRFGTGIPSACDMAILVGKQQCEPIVEGIEAAGWQSDNYVVVNSMKKALALALEHTVTGDVIMIENDLPDAYL